MPARPISPCVSLQGRLQARLGGAQSAQSNPRATDEGGHFMQIRSLGIAGAGAWGTALALQAARAGLRPVLWARRPDAAAAIAASRENADYLPGSQLPPEIAVTGHLAEALAADAVLYVQPAQHLRAFCAAARGSWRAGAPLVLCAKGIELGSGLLLTDVAAETLPEAPVAVLSGPSFAGEVAAGLPTAVVIASPDAALNEALMAGAVARRLPPLWQPGSGRGRAGGRGQERARHRLRHRDGARPGGECARRFGDARPRRAGAAEPGPGRPDRDHAGPCRRRRRGADLQLDEIAQRLARLRAGARARARGDPGGAAQHRGRRAHRRRAGGARRRGCRSTCRSPAPSPPSSPAAPRSTRRSAPCSPAR